MPVDRQRYRLSRDLSVFAGPSTAAPLTRYGPLTRRTVLWPFQTWGQ